MLPVSVMLIFMLMPFTPVRAVSSPTLFIAPSSQPLASSNSTVTYAVNVSNVSPDSPIAGWAVYVWTNNSILNPVNITVGSFLPGAVQAVLCINDLSYLTILSSSCTDGDGPGVVHSEVYSGNTAYGNGTLFTISYKAVAGSGAPLVPFSDALFDANGMGIAHTTVRGSYGVAAPPDFHVVITNWFRSATVFGVSVASTNGFVGVVNFSLAVPLGVTASISPTSMAIGFPPTSSNPALLFVSTPKTAGNYTVQLTASSGTLSHTEAVTVAVRDFLISADPARVGPVYAGSTASSTITVQSLNHFAGPVSLLAISQPGLTATLSPTGLTGSGTSVLTVGAASAGNYTVNVVAYSGELYHTMIITVRVVDFTLTANPDRFVPTREGSQRFRSSIDLTSLQGFTGRVDLSLASPAGFQASLSSTSLPLVSGGSVAATLTIRVLGNAQPGTYLVVVTAKTGSLVHTVTVQVLVPPELARA